MELLIFRIVTFIGFLDGNSNNFCASSIPDVFLRTEGSVNDFFQIMYIYRRKMQSLVFFESIAMEHKAGCTICGKSLIYTVSEESLICYCCGNEYDAQVQCENAHFVCDSCHQSNANDYIYSY